MEMFLGFGLIVDKDWEYTNRGWDNIPFICGKGHRLLRSFSSVKKSSHCIKCKKEKYIEAIALKKGFTIDPNWRYIDCEGKVPFTCKNGHKHSTTVQILKGNADCAHCHHNVYDTKKVRNLFKEKGFYICDKNWEYESSNKKVKFICSNGHKMEMTTYSAITQDRGCKFCNSKTIVNTKSIIEEFSKSNLKVDKDWEFEGIDKSIPFKCSEGHEGKRTYTYFLKSNMCSVCSKSKSYTTPEAKEKISKRGFTILNQNWQYKNINEKIGVVCKNGHNIKISLERKEIKCIKCEEIEKAQKAQEEINARGFRVVDKNWQHQNGAERIDAICDKGHLIKIRMESIKTIKCDKCKILSMEELTRKVFLSQGLVVDADWKYTTRYEKVPFTCQENGHKHEALYNGVKVGGGCMKCNKNYQLTEEKIRSDFLAGGFVIPDDWRYDEPIHSLKIPCACSNGHDHGMRYDHIKKGINCSQCTRVSQIVPDTPALVYFLKFKNTEGKDYFKIGITTKSVEERFYNDIREGFEMEIVKIHKTTWEKAVNIETLLKRNLKEIRIYGRYDLSHSGGGTECFDLEHMKTASKEWEDLTQQVI